MNPPNLPSYTTSGFGPAASRPARWAFLTFIPRTALALALAAPATGWARQQQAEDARAALREGRYDQAIADLRAAVGNPAAPAEHTLEAQRLLVRALTEVGRYDEAIAAARTDGGNSPAAPPGLANAMGEALRATGELDAAELAFRQALDGDAPDGLTAELNLAVLQYERGEVAEAMAEFDRFIDYYNRSDRLSAADLTAVATAVRYLGEEDHRLFQDALRAYDDAIAADPADFEPQILVGELFLEKYQNADAEAAFQTVLRVNPRHPRALLGMARAFEPDRPERAAELVRSALDVNPNLVPARVLMSRLHMALEEYDDALDEVRAALDVNPVSLEALSVLASIHHVRGDRAAFEEVSERIFVLNPGHAELYTTIAELSARQRQYHEAVDLARRAIELNPRSWRAHAVLGTNQLRLGRIADGRASLETAFEGDPFHVWAKNTLDLLDTFERFDETTTDRFTIAIHGRESALLGPYTAALAEEAFDRLAERYGDAPPTPIRIELFPSSADFAVRTLGVPGLGALGVSFGPVVAMDSPSARRAGEFNWGSTLWHELAHSFHLALSDHRVPRWFSEGLAVLEERQARPGWGAGPSLPFLTALRDGRLLPIAELNNGFVRPSEPGQIGVSYYHASLVLEKIERDHGVAALRAMLRGYAEGLGTEQLFRSVLGTDIEAFDEQFHGELQERFGRSLAALATGPAAVRGPQGADGDANAAATTDRAGLERRVAQNPDDFFARMSLGRLLVEAEAFDDAVPHFERALDLFPDYAGADGPDAFLARIYRASNDLDRAARHLERLTRLDATHYEATLELAEVLEELEDLTRAAAALERAIYIFPYSLELHTRLATLYGRLDRWPDAVRARTAALALEPSDQASALYELAHAYHMAGEAAAARRYVLRALEQAPHFREAQELLLELSEISLDSLPAPGTARNVRGGTA